MSAKKPCDACSKSFCRETLDQYGGNTCGNCTTRMLKNTPSVQLAEAAAKAAVDSWKATNTTNKAAQTERKGAWVAYTEVRTQVDVTWKRLRKSGNEPVGVGVSDAEFSKVEALGDTAACVWETAAATAAATKAAATAAKAVKKAAKGALKEATAEASVGAAKAMREMREMRERKRKRGGSVDNDAGLHALLAAIHANQSGDRGDSAPVSANVSDTGVR